MFVSDSKLTLQCFHKTLSLHVWKSNAKGHCGTIEFFRAMVYNFLKRLSCENSFKKTVLTTFGKLSFTLTNAGVVFTAYTNVAHGVLRQSEKCFCKRPYHFRLTFGARYIPCSHEIRDGIVNVTVERYHVALRKLCTSLFHMSILRKNCEKVVLDVLGISFNC